MSEEDIVRPEPTSLPVLSRRDLIRCGAVTVTGGFLQPFIQPSNVKAATKETPRGTAECVIYVNMVGGPSQMDTFDVKESKSTPQDLDIRIAKTGFRWPFGLLPKTGAILEDLVVARSMAAWDNVHALAQFYQQVGHQFTAARSKEMPSMGSVVAYEMLIRAKERDFLPPFIALNFPSTAQNGQLVREGFLDSSAAPLSADLRTGASLPFLLAADYKDRFNHRYELLRSLDTTRQLAGSGVSKRLLEWDSFTKGVHKMMNSPEIASVFELDETERKRYGKSHFGDSCLIARNMVAAQAGARFILLNHGGWDHHGSIYGKDLAQRGEDTVKRGGLYAMCAEFDPGFAALVSDLKNRKSRDGQSSLLDKTFIVANGEFGRTPGELTDIKGRDHWPDVRCGLFAGGGIRHGGRVIGKTDDLAAKVVGPEWNRPRPIYPEDVTATIYSVLGIDWSKKISHTPSGRDFEYVEPMSGTTFLGSTEIGELFT
jgi:hypothetical protein